MDNSCKVPEVKPITIKRFGTAGLVPTVPTTLDCNLWQKTDLKDGEFAINTVDDKLYIRSGNQIIELTNQSSGGGTGTVTSIATAGLISGGTITTTGTITTSMNTNKLVGRGTAGTGVMEEITLGTNLSLSGTTLNATDQFTGTVTSVGLTMPSAFTVANSPITSSGDIAVTGAGLASQYVRGDGSLANFPTNGGGGSAVNYYLNGSVNQGTFGGDTYYELSKTPIIGTGTNFTRTNAQGNGYIASFITDAGDPNLLNIPGGNWALEFYFSANSGGGSPSFYGELYKVSNTNVFTLIASGSTNPEGITQGTTIDQYFTSIPVPQTTLLATDRLAIRVFVNTGGRNITLHTEDNNLCQVITTFSTGLNALNGLTAQVQNFAVGTSGTDFAINSATDTHTFNLPTASALNRGALSSADWTTFNNKVSTGAITGSGLTMATARLLGRSTAGSGAVEEITIGSGLTLSAGTLTAAGGSGITIGTTAIASGTVNRILFEGAGNVVQQDSTFVWNNTDKRLILGTEAVADTNSRLVVIGKGTSTNTTFAVHNSTGTNNALIVRDDSWIRFGASAFTSISTANQQWEFGAGAGRKVLTIQGNNSTAQPSFIRFQIDDGANANKVILFDNNNGIGGLGTAIRSGGSSPSQLFIEYQASNTEQILEIRDNNLSGRAILAAGNNTARLVLVRSGTTSIGLYDNNFNDSFWNPTGVRTFIFGAAARTNASALVEMTSTTRGFLPPRMTTAQRDLIGTPAAGLVIYNTTTNKLNVYTTAWEAVTSL